MSTALPNSQTAKPDSVCLIATTHDSMVLLKNSIDLRGVESVTTVTFDEALGFLRENRPMVLLMDAGGEFDRASDLLMSLTHAGIEPPPSIVLADRFEEEFFLSCDEFGVRDFLVKPVPEAYLMSRILLTFREERQRALLAQREEILKDMGVMSSRSNVFSPTYMQRLLKDYAYEASVNSNRVFSLVFVQLTGSPLPLNPTLETVLFHKAGMIIKGCARGLDVVGEFDEQYFVVLLPDTCADGAEALSRRITRRFGLSPIRFMEQTIPVKVKVGAATCEAGRHYEELIQIAIGSIHAD